MDRFDYLIVGAGFAGATCAERLASAGKTVLVIDQRDHVAGNAYDRYNDDGLLIHQYGAHIFHTNSKEVFDYLSRFTAWRPYEHRVLANVDGRLLPVPINTHTLSAFGGDETKAKDAIYRPYTRKQWGCEPEALDPSVLARVKVRDSYDDRYFTDTYQCLPSQGFTALIQKMLTHPNIDVRLSTSYADAPAWSTAYADIIWTGPIDQFFGYRFGKLPYRSAWFQHETIHATKYQPVGVVNYPSEALPYTRITEFKHLTGQRHPLTAVALEYPTDKGEPFWPVPKPENALLYKQYKALADARSDVHFCGRLGTYQYLDIHQVVAQALKLTKTLLSKETADYADTGT